MLLMSVLYYILGEKITNQYVRMNMALISFGIALYYALSLFAIPVLVFRFTQYFYVSTYFIMDNTLYRTKNKELAIVSYLIIALTISFLTINQIFLGAKL